MKKLKLKYPKFERFPVKRIVFLVIVVALAIPTFFFTRNFIASQDIFDLPGLALKPTAAVTPDATGATATPVIAAPEDALPPVWDGASRVTLLFIGLDERDWEAGQGAPRSDTMILFTIDPLTKTAGMLSIPRDMWVNIPGSGYSRINTAYSVGEGSKLPGGGPGLAMKTVEQFIGVPIQYYAQVDFRAFEEAIDAMGGLYMCIPEKIRIDPIGPKEPYNLQPGCRTLYGYEVLAYARTRSTKGGDVDRANRQQQVIMALVEQVFSPQRFPSMVANASKIYGEAAAGLRTNLTFDQALQLGVLLSQVPQENIKRGVIDYTMVTLDNVTLAGQNASIFKPIPDKIRVLRDEIFTAGGPLSPMAQGDPAALMQADAPRVRVLNGTYTAGLAERTANYLISQGMPVTEVGNADKLYDRTVLVIYGPKLYTLRYLVSTFGINARYQIVFNPDPTAPVDIEVRLGSDWLNMIPEGF